MNILGMGSIELVVILLVGFIILGPRRMVDAARLFGKATREIRRITEDLPDMVLDENLEEPRKRPGGYHQGVTIEATDSGASGPDAAVDPPEHDGPVGFRPDTEQGDGPRAGPKPLAEQDSGEPPAQSGPIDGSMRRNGDKLGPRGSQKKS